MGIPLAFILTSWFFKYAYILFDHTVRGFRRTADSRHPDAESLQRATPPRPGGDLRPDLSRCEFRAAHDASGPSAGHRRGGGTVPARLGGHPRAGAKYFQGRIPLARVRMVWRLGPMYALVLAIIAGYSLLIALLARWAPWLPVRIAIFMFCLLYSAYLAARCTSGVTSWGLETWVSRPATLQIARVARTLLADFPTRFAGDPCVAAAAALARHLGP
jgi:hypothetical protein